MCGKLHWSKTIEAFKDEKQFEELSVEHDHQTANEVASLCPPKGKYVYNICATNPSPIATKKKANDTNRHIGCATSQP